MEEKPKIEKVGVVEYEHVGREYLEERGLRRFAGTALIWGLGVGYVISGEFFGWNFGFFQGGMGGFLLATVLIAIMYTTMVYGIAEMAASLPTTGGPYAFARRALGVWGGYITGLGATVEYVLATSVIAVGIGGYVVGLFELDAEATLAGLHYNEWIMIATYVVFLAINLVGVRETLVSLFVITAVSVVVLIVWGIALLPHFEWGNFFDLAYVGGDPTQIAPGTGSWFPRGIFIGTLAAVPSAAWFYLAIEGCPLAAEETKNPARDMPRGSILAMLSLVAFSMIAFWVGGGACGAFTLGGSLNPNPECAEVAVGRNWLFWLISTVGLTGLIASFHSIIFAFGRIIYALSRAGYFPRFLSLTGPRKTPYPALIIPSIIGAILMIVYNRIDPAFAGSNLIQISVFAALITYITMMLSFLVLRAKEPALERPYRTPGGVVTASIALVLAAISLGAGLAYTTAARWTIFATVGALALGVVYFWLYSRHRLVAEAPEEEFALIAKAEAEVDTGGSSGDS